MRECPTAPGAVPVTPLEGIFMFTGGSCTAKPTRLVFIKTPLGSAPVTLNAASKMIVGTLFSERCGHVVAIVAIGVVIIRPSCPELGTI